MNIGIRNKIIEPETQPTYLMFGVCKNSGSRALLF